VVGRFKLLTDEHWSKAHVIAARLAGWEAVRVVDVAELIVEAGVAEALHAEAQRGSDA